MSRRHTVYTVTLRMEQDVEVLIEEGSDAITRVTGPEGEDWRQTCYDLYTEADVLQMFAANAAFNGVEDAGELDGWADIKKGEVVMKLLDGEPRVEGVDVYEREAPQGGAS